MQEVENTNIDHSRFVAEAPARAKWKETEEGGRGIDAAGEDFESVTEGKGTSISHCGNVIFLPAENASISCLVWPVVKYRSKAINKKKIDRTL